MPGNTKIEWATKVWNPVTGCDKVSPGCDNCYAEALANRFAGAKAFPNGFKVTLHPERLNEPSKWYKPQRVFVNSMSDLFHKDIPVEFIESAWVSMICNPQHQFLVLTKRPDRMEHIVKRFNLERIDDLVLKYFRDHPSDYAVIRPSTKWPAPNIWLGTSVENQQMADARIPVLLRVPAAVRFISAEPLLGPIELTKTPPEKGSIPLNGATYDDIRGCLPKWQKYPMRAKLANGLDWVIVGGESGRGARPCHLTWIGKIINDCQDAEVPVFVKQFGSKPYVDLWSEKENRVIDSYRYDCGYEMDSKGGNPDEWPDGFRIRQFPGATTFAQKDA